MPEPQQSTELRGGEVTIVIVNYKTELLTRLCLRSIRKFTRFPYHVIVVDNDSNDESLDYLRSLSWINLIERSGDVSKSGSWAHGTALDIGLSKVETEYVMAMHSDTFVHRENWLGDLVGLMEGKPGMACVGGGKLDLKPKWEVVLKRFTDAKAWLRRLKPKKKRSDFYIRTICGLYRTGILREEQIGFAKNVEKGMTCGQQLYYDLIDRGYETTPLSTDHMAKFIYHLAHATMVLNPEFTVRERTEKKCRKKLKKIFDSTEVQEILNDASLDQ